MPPRRATRASSSSRLFDGSSEAGGPLDTVRTQDVHTAARGMSPGPAKYSSAYGSPPTMVPTRQNVARQKYNLTTALSHVVSAVEADNENDARDRAERDAERQRRRPGSATEPAQVTEAVQPANALPARPVRVTRRKQREKVSDSASPEPVEPAEPAKASTEPKDIQGTHIEPMQPAAAASANAPLPDATPARDFADEDGIFAEAEIFTPTLPPSLPSTTSAAGVVSRASNLLQRILHSPARHRMSTIREGPDDEAVQQAYPQLTFLAAQPDNNPAASAAAAEEPASTPTRRTTRTASRTATKPTSAHIATPGPKPRARRNASRAAPDPAADADELATDPSDGAAASQQRTRQRQPQVIDTVPDSEEPEAEEPEAEEPEAAKEAAMLEKDNQGVRPQPQCNYPDRGAGRVGVLARATQFLAMALTLVVLGAVALRVVVVSTAPDALYEGYRVDNRLHWYGDDWRSNLRQFVPFALLHPLGAMSDDEFARMNGLLQRHANEVAKMRHTQGLHGDALDHIRKILPAVVHMELDKRGRPVVAQEFWHALKDTIQADQDIFTLLPRKDGTLAVSDLQWTALERQLEASGLLQPDASNKALTAHDVETIAETTLSRSWEDWLRRNQDRVRAVLGVSKQQDQQQDQFQQHPPAYGDLVEQLSDDQLAKLAQQMAASRQAREVLVPRQDFLQILQSTFVEHRLAIKGELADLETRVLDLARAAAQAVQASRASSSPAASDAGLSKREITALVDQLVRKSISNAQLEAMARGTIAANWQAALVNQVNFFSRNTGAAFNRHLSSPSYAPHKLTFWERVHALMGGGSRSSSAQPLRPVPASLQGSAALEPWEQDGDCWCASMSRKNGSGGAGPAELAVRLGLRVLPQYVVVEHIQAAATLDPGAMPQDLEVWAQVTDYAAQRPLMDWSLNQFPDTDDADPLFGWGFVKIGAFRYENGGSSGGKKPSGEAQVFRLSPDLETLDAVTDHVLVRAVTNHGGVDHTCFYRVRLYGEHRPDVVV